MGSPAQYGSKNRVESYISPPDSVNLLLIRNFLTTMRESRGKGGKMFATERPCGEGPVGKAFRGGTKIQAVDRDFWVDGELDLTAGTGTGEQRRLAGWTRLQPG